MLANFLITFRETLEAALIVGIIISYLVKTDQRNYLKFVYSGIILSILCSIIGAVIFNKFAGGFSGTAEQVFEGITMLIGAGLLTTMIFWMMGQRNIVKDLENKVAHATGNLQKWGLFFLVFVSILREGIETVIFLNAASYTGTDSYYIGSSSGILSAGLLGYGLFATSAKINLKSFFNYTSLLLVLFAAGLMAHGVHELQEAAIIPVIAEHIWDINPPLNLDGSYPLLHEKGNVGSIFKGLFGYNGNPSLLEVFTYVAYLFSSLLFWRLFQPGKK